MTFTSCIAPSLKISMDINQQLNELECDQLQLTPIPRQGFKLTTERIS